MLIDVRDFVLFWTAWASLTGICKGANFRTENFGLVDALLKSIESASKRDSAIFDLGYSTNVNSSAS